MTSEDNDCIRVICESSNQRKELAKKNFEKIKPFLDKGMIYSNACIHAGLVDDSKGSWRTYSWYKDIVSYGEKQGYPYKNYSGKGGGKRR